MFYESVHYCVCPPTHEFAVVVWCLVGMTSCYASLLDRTAGQAIVSSCMQKRGR